MHRRNQKNLAVGHPKAITTCHLYYPFKIDYLAKVEEQPFLSSQ